MTHKKQYSKINKQQQGFTLVEFMVASVLGLVVIAGAGALYSYTKRLNDVGMARVATLQDLRSAATMITQDARNAGVFGCANLGRRWVYDANGNGAVDMGITNGLTSITQLQTLDDVPNITERSAGVRWIKRTDPNVSEIWSSIGSFVQKSDVLVFYYGEGSLSFNSDTAGGVAFNTKEQHPNQIVTNTLKDKGWVVAAGCNTLAIQQSNVNNLGATYSVTNIPASVSSASTSGPSATSGITSAILPNSDMILQRYKVVAYVVGTIPGEEDKDDKGNDKSSLYRFEYGNNDAGWTAPQQLAKNVTGMDVEYLFVTNCPTSLQSTSSSSGSGTVDLNGQAFTVMRNPDQNAIEDDLTVSPDWGMDGAAQGPSSIKVKLTYDFPKLRGGSIATGDEGQEFNISAVVRGGNVCASRKISQ